MARVRSRVTREQQIKVAAMITQHPEWTQDDVARACGVSQAYVSRFMRGYVATPDAPAPNKAGVSIQRDFSETINLLRRWPGGWEAAAQKMYSNGYALAQSELDAAEIFNLMQTNLASKHKQMRDQERYEREYPEDRPLYRTAEQLQQDSIIQAERERVYQEESPPVGMEVGMLEWPAILEHVGVRHPLLQRYLRTPKDQQPTLQLAIRYTLNPRSMSIKEQLKMEMRDNVAWNVEQLYTRINGSLSWRAYALQHSQSHSVRGEEEYHDTALEEFIKGSSEEGGK